MNPKDFFEQKHVPSRTIMQSLRERYKQQNKKIVFTNGCFDIIHRGHVSYLTEAKTLGDILVIGVNTDESVKSYKGDKRPITPLEDRMYVLAALECVDHVISFGERLPNELIKVVQPNIHVKGGDYTIDQLPEAQVVQELSGKVVILPFTDNLSTTNLINKILDTYK